MNKKLKRKQALIMAEPYRTPFNSKVAKVSGDVIEDSVGEIKYATSFDGATKIVDGNKNLLVFPDTEETTVDGITYSIKDGVITFSVTPSETIRNMTFHFNAIGINIGDTYSIALFNQFTSPIGFFVQDKSNSDEANQYLGINENIATTWTVNAGSQYEAIVFYLDKNKTYTNEVIKPILVSGSTIPTEFEPNFKNLLGFDDVEETTTTGGVTYSIKNGVLKFKGSSTAPLNLFLKLKNRISKNTIVTSNLFGDKWTYSNNIYLSEAAYSYDKRTTFYKRDNLPITFTTEYDYGYLLIQINYSNVDLTLKPILVKGDIAPSKFIPFANPYFVSLGQNGSVQYNGLEPREIDLKGNVIGKINTIASDKLSNYSLTKNTKVVDLGSLTWEATDKTVNNKYRMSSQSLKSEIVYSSSSSIVGNILSTTYNSLSTSDTYLEKKGISLETDGTIKIYDPDYNTSDKLEAFKKAIRGTLLMYQVKNPTTINTTSFKTFKEDTNATISDDNFISSPNAITETFKPTRSYDFKVNGFSNVVKSSNLLNIPDKANTTTNGITYSIKNGVITLNGTCTAKFEPIHLSNLGLENCSYQMFYSKGVSSTSYVNMIMTEDEGWTNSKLINYNNNINGIYINTNVVNVVRLEIFADTTFDNLQVKLMAVSGSTIPSTFEPYFEPYIESFADKKNLLGFDDVEETTTTGGVTYSIKNGVFTLNGTSSKSHNIFINLKKPINSGTYSFNAFTVTGSRADIYLNAPLVPLASLAASTTTKSNISLTSATQLSVWFPKDEKYDNRTFKPMLVEGNKIPTTFLPYQDKYSAFLNVKGKNLLEFEPYYSFTKEVLIKQPLRKFDYLTYDGVYRQTNEIVLDGTNALFVSDNGTIQLLNIPNADSLNTDYAINYASQLMVTTSDLPLVPSRDIQVENKKGIGTNNGIIFLKLDDSADNSLNNWTVEKVNNYFKQNPITITYKTTTQTFEATSLTRLLFKNGYNKITAFDSINNNAIVEYLEYYKSKDSNAN